MKEIFLLKLGEIVLKGANKRQFENKLRQNVRRRMKKYGNFDVYILQSTVYVEPMDEEADVDGAWEACRSIFGVVSLCRCRPCEKDLDAIFAAIENYLGDDLDCAQSFKVESKRSDKRFPLTSIQLSQEIGGRLAEAHPGVEVDVHHPDYTVYVEVRDLSAYVHGPAEPGAGGLPTGVGGRAMVLLSGGIDSPVAAYMMAKRGVEVEAVHFFSYPYTSQLAKDKVIELARLVTKYSGRMTVNVVSFTEIQEAIRDNCPEESNGVEGDKMGNGHVKTAVHPGIYLENDLLIFGQPNPEIIIHAGHDAENPFQLAAHIDPVAGLQVEPVVVIGERPSGLRKTNLHHRLPGRGADRFCLPRCRSFLSLFGRSTKTTDRKTHSFSSIHIFSGLLRALNEKVKVR